ncbi:MAG: 16S rRNA (uracil(1498)-N(3))-methyltransferase [Clostridiales bacterium]|nr:16S rRNA (uracil(1498)-N(3))-methyltransferase [Clostridiales bacterium]
MSRFFVNQGSVKADHIEITDKEDIKHICKVLRLCVGDKLEVSDASEFEYETEILSADHEMVTVRILDKQRFSREPEIKVTLFQGVPKHGKMETIIQKAVELGVYSIVPVFTKRTVVTEKQGFEKKLDRWNKISAEAVKQCKRGIVPEIERSVSFSQMLDRLAEYDLVLFPYENENESTIKDALRGLAEPVRHIALIIGPEGGFSDEEANEVTALKGRSVSLGKTILRTETAGPAALAMIMYELEM